MYVVVDEMFLLHQYNASLSVISEHTKSYSFVSNCKFCYWDILVAQS